MDITANFGSNCPPRTGAKDESLPLLVILSAKRNLGDTVIVGVKEMGSLIDPMEETFFRRLYEKGLKEGERERPWARGSQLVVANVAP